MTEPAVRHPIFARAWDRLCGLIERELAVQRQELLAGLTGRVLEIGAGNGNNFEHYPATVDEVIALEPEPYLRGKAHEAATRAPVRVTVREGVAEALPVGDESFDAAIASRVLCTVRDQERALAELRRVVRPGAELRFLEHVRSPHARTAWLQERLDGSGIWPWLGGGCHCARDTLGAVTAAGFGVQRVRAFALGPTWMFVNPHVVGVARATPTLQEATWPSARIVRDVSEVAALKQQPGDAIYAVGGPGLVGSLINAGLVDELRLILHPVSAGAGEGEATVGKLPHCEGLELVAAEPLAAGRVHLTYRLGASTPQSAE